MAIVFPKKRLKDEEILDIDDINDAFRDVTQEAGNALGEHNWKQNAFGVADLDPTAAIVVSSVYVESDNGSPYGSGSAPPATSHTVGGDYSWRAVDGLTQTVTTGNSLLWVMFSGQYSQPDSDLETEVTFCIAHNGNVLPETVTGTSDSTNDAIAHGVLTERSPVVMDMLLPVAPGSHTFTVLVRTAKNFQWTWASYTVDDSVDNRELIVLEMK